MSGFELAFHYPERIKNSWSYSRFKHTLYEVDERNQNNSASGKEELLGLSKSRGVLKKTDMEQRASEAADYTDYKRVRMGQLVSNKMQAWNGMFGISPFDGFTSPDYAIYEFFGNIDTSFIEYVLHSSIFSAEFHCRSRGMGTGFLRLNPREFLATEFYHPNLITQKRIITFLDRKIANIDSLIKKNERLISLCEEKRQSLIDEVFNVSHIFTAIKNVADINYDILPSDFPKNVEICYADLSRVCPLNGINPEVIAFKDAPSRARRVIHEDDVLFASVGPFLKKVMSAKVQDEGTIVSTGFFVLKAKKNHYSGFLEKLLQSTHVLSEVEKGAVGAIYAAINDSTFKNIKIPVFSYEEQVVLSDKMEQRITKINLLSKKCYEMNVLLKEKRSALITAAVTGQIEIPET